MVGRVHQLQTYERAYGAAMDLYRASKAWPKEERYALVDQIRRSSRSVCANMAEAWAKRPYPKHFVSKLSDAHGEAEETLVWIRFARDCDYLNPEAAERLTEIYRRVIGGLIKMMRRPGPWCGPARR
ncbi:MAG: four helix bundle protein [Bacteroidota bacterium]